MKRPANKATILALVPPAASQTDFQVPEKSTLIDSFEGWLNSVAPMLLQSTLKAKSKVGYRPRRSLTSSEMVNVSRATVRESNEHRLWPPDVVLSFLAADVIKRKRR